ncbi:22534_t:CDS:2, partial [Rhizophagus irregularis]
ISSFFLKEICDFQLSLEVEYVASEVWMDFWLSLEAEYANFQLSLEKHNANILAENVELKAELAKLKYDFDLSNFIKSQQA